jgi:short chain dehydrogenase
MSTVLVTGAARGIGRATALRLADAGWDVIAGVRGAEDGETLAQERPGRISSLILDITDGSHVAALNSALPERLDAVVNNAGVAVGGPIEAVPLSELRRQLDVNVVGQAAVTQAVLPRLRETRGRLVFVSSLSGRVASLSPAHRDLYAKHIAGFRKSIPRSQRMAAPTDGVAATIERALTTRRPRARYVVGTSARVQAVLAQLTPTVLRDMALRAGTGVPRRLQ